MKGYIAMIAVDGKLRGKGIGSQLVQRFENDVKADHDVSMLVLDTECVNKAALSLYICEFSSYGVLQG